MKITDINCFVGYIESAPYNLYTPEMLSGKMDKYGITNAVVYSKWAIGNHKEGNAEISALSEKSDGRFSACYVLAPNLDTRQMPSADELISQLKAERPAAIKLYPARNGYILDSFYCGELLDIINEFKIPLLLDMNEGLNFATLPTLANEFPDIPFVVLSAGLRFSHYVSPLITKRNNVYFDTRDTIDMGYLDEMVNRFGSEKFLFGSNMPHMDPSGMLSMIIYGEFAAEHKENILSDNWQRLQEAIKWQ